MKLSVLLAGLSVAVHAEHLQSKDNRPVDIPTKKPDNARVVAKDFVGFGIESAFFDHFANPFSENLVSSLAARMSKPPIIRVGGTGGDKVRFNPHQKEDKVCIKVKGEEDVPCNSHKATFILGPKFFKTYGLFKDANMILQAPMQNPINATNTLAFVQEAWKNLGKGSRVAAIALGNEVEYIYKANAKQYVNAALKLQKRIVKSLGLSGEDAKIFEAGNTASGTIKDDKPYNVKDILDAKINENGRISNTAEHYYQVHDKDGPFTDKRMQEIMINHKAITDRFELYMPSLKASHDAGVEYAITEDAAVLGGGPESWAGGFAYALWAVDFNLAAMARGVYRVMNLAGRPYANRVVWVPDDKGTPPRPQVRPPYPAAVFVADFIGKDIPSAVKEIDVKGSNVLSAYAMYDDKSNRLERVALVNLKLYNGTRSDSDSRGKETFQVPVGDDVKCVTVRNLHAENGVAAMGFDFGGPDSNVTWAGEQWAHAVDNGEGHFPTGEVVQDTVQVKDGIASVVVPDSEAAIVFLHHED